jgi:hypothetical protein
MNTTWLAGQLSLDAPGLWFTVSLLLTALLLSLRPYIPPKRRSAIWAAHWLLVPYLGLLAGGVSPRLIGLTGHDWLASLGLGLGLIFVVVVLLILVRAVVDLDPDAGPSTRGVRRLGRHTLRSTLLWTGIEQFHWCFLRGVLWEMILALPSPPDLPGYWAIWSAAAIILAELLLLRPGFYPFVIQIVALITTSILFFYTRNFWLCWALHAGVQLIAAPPRLLPFAPMHPAGPRRAAQNVRA